MKKKKELKILKLSWKIWVAIGVGILLLSIVALSITGNAVVANSARCKDSDNGINPSTPGTCKNYNIWGTLTGMYKDSCASANSISSLSSTSGLREYYCDKANIFAAPTCTYTMPKVCGKCRNESGVAYCCAPYTCASLNLSCGAYNDGCGGIVNCGNCSTGQICDMGKCYNCTPRTCDGVECGIYSDGCQGTRNCGTCAADKTCLKGKCVTPCTTEVCPVLKYSCGSTEPAYYFCANGSVVNCGTCPTGEHCITGMCTPCITSCASYGYNCGTVQTGCNSTLNCGSCTLNKTCVNNRCQ